MRCAKCEAAIHWDELFEEFKTVEFVTGHKVNIVYNVRCPTCGHCFEEVEPFIMFGARWYREKNKEKEE